MVGINKCKIMLRCLFCALVLSVLLLLCGCDDWREDEVSPGWGGPSTGEVDF